MRFILTFFLWCLLFILCWPIAILAVLLFPLVWLLILPFRIVGYGLEGLLGLLRGLFLLPARILGGSRRAA